jgi:hypothetical protein
VVLSRSSTEAGRFTLAKLVGGCALLGIILAAAAILVAAAVHGGLQQQTFVAATIAGGVCWLGASLALVATYVGNVYRAPVQGMLVSMIGRVGLPLAALMALPQFGGPAAAPGVMTTILGVYLVALVVETILALQVVPRTAPAGTSPPGASTLETKAQGA